MCVCVPSDTARVAVDEVKDKLKDAIKASVAAQGPTLAADLRAALAAHAIPPSLPFPQTPQLSLQIGVAGPVSSSSAFISAPFVGLFALAGAPQGVCQTALPAVAPKRGVALAVGDCVFNSLFASLFKAGALHAPPFNYSATQQVALSASTAPLLSISSSSGVTVR